MITVRVIFYVYKISFSGFYLSRLTASISMGVDMTDIQNELYMKLPCVFRKKLMQGELTFPEETKFKYENILAYRLIIRDKDDTSPVTRKDFCSYFELGKVPKKFGMRASSYDPKNDPQFYGVSLFLEKKILEQIMRLPKPRKKLALGFVHAEGGPEFTKDKHVCWWLFEDADVSGFKIDD